HHLEVAWRRVATSADLCSVSRHPDITIGPAHGAPARGNTTGPAHGAPARSNTTGPAHGAPARSNATGPAHGGRRPATPSDVRVCLASGGRAVPRRAPRPAGSRSAARALAPARLCRRGGT